MPRFRLFKPLQSISDDMLNLDALRFLAALGVASDRSQLNAIRRLGHAPS